MDKYYDLSKCNSDFLNKKEELLYNGWEIKEEIEDFLFLKKVEKEFSSNIEYLELLFVVISLIFFFLPLILWF